MLRSANGLRCGPGRGGVRPVVRDGRAVDEPIQLPTPRRPPTATGFRLSQARRGLARSRLDFVRPARPKIGATLDLEAFATGLRPAAAGSWRSTASLTAVETTTAGLDGAWATPLPGPNLTIAHATRLNASC